MGPTALELDKKRKSKGYFAHSLPGRPPEKWQPLSEHLLAVAKLSRRFAGEFGAGEWGYLAGLWHDLGKYSLAFQQYLDLAEKDYHFEESVGNGGISSGSLPHIDHTTAGAQYAVETAGLPGHLLAYIIAGHHSGLLNAISDGACLEKRLKKPVDPWEHGLEELPQVSIPTSFPPHLQKQFIGKAGDGRGLAFSVAFFTRMLFSCLVDADFLDTEAFLQPENSGSRNPWPLEVLVRLEEALDKYVASLPTVDTQVNRERRRVREACLDAASRSPGFFSLTVPTGGGKTLSSLAFALRHARLHGLRRVIYVIPFTSIIEQNAEVFRKVFQPLAEKGVPDPVLEHHSALDAGKESLLTRLAAENWDAPLVVTTSVQFYESLFSHRPGRCRKLHNLVRSVIILDEVQKIPVERLEPCIRALRELTAGYGASIVLCTATQPAIHRRSDFPIGIEDVHEIIPNPPSLYHALKRVDVDPLGTLTDEELADRLLAHEQVLCIVNTRRHARFLFEQLRKNDNLAASVLHLSAAMCPEHRSVVLNRIRKKLESGEPCRLISTQLVEAGVDLDFPVVYRSMAGLDSIAQAAGRCNRNGRLRRGRTFVFSSEHPGSESFLRNTVNATVQIIGGGGQGQLYEDLLSLESVEHYFKIYYWQQSDRWDKDGLLGEFLLVRNNRDLPFQFAFRTVGEKFKIIADTGETVLVPWGERGRDLCEQLRRIPPPHPRGLLRPLQRFGVQVWRRAYLSAVANGIIEVVHERYPVLVSSETNYDEHLGLLLEREDLDPETLLI